MRVIQLKLSVMSIFAYLVVDESTGTSVLIDPAGETRRILERVDREGGRVSKVINTHGHADHTAGNAAVIKATGAELLLHEADADSLRKVGNRIFSRILGGRSSPPANRLLKDDDQIEFGDSNLRVIHTPGHTPGSICLLGDGQLFTGDTLFVGAVGRTDLPGGSHSQLVRSVRERIYVLPPETAVWPGHDYGFFPQSTVGQEMKTNPAVPPES